MCGLKIPKCAVKQLKHQSMMISELPFLIFLLKSFYAAQVVGSPAPASLRERTNAALAMIQDTFFLSVQQQVTQITRPCRQFEVV